MGCVISGFGDEPQRVPKANNYPSNVRYVVPIVRSRVGETMSATLDKGNTEKMKKKCRRELDLLHEYSAEI